MQDFERFDEALEDARSSYMNDLSRSLSLVLDEFYCGLKTVCVSSATGEGFEDVMTAINESVEAYKKEYVPMYEKVLAEKRELDEQERKKREEEALKGKAVHVVGSAKLGDEEIVLETELNAKIDRIHLGGVDEENEEDAEVLRD
uniref:GPN-loop GTPase n=1 Tax=Caenorhabditis japonica TaxID=281687 RepID=A0A8R1ITM9_CAEJA